MSTNLAVPALTGGQANPETTVNDATGAIDAALTETLTVDLTGDVTLTNAQYRGAIRISVTPAGASKTLTLPAIKRLLLIDNFQASHAITIKVGTTTFNLAVSTATFVYTDGTTNGLEQLAIGGSGGGGTGNTFHVSSVDPITTDGASGDVWYQTTSGHLWTKSGSTWTDVGAIGGGGGSSVAQIYGMPSSGRVGSVNNTVTAGLIQCCLVFVPAGATISKIVGHLQSAISGGATLTPVLYAMNDTSNAATLLSGGTPISSAAAGQIVMPLTTPHTFSADTWVAVGVLALVGSVLFSGTTNSNNVFLSGQSSVPSTPTFGGESNFGTQPWFVGRS